MPDYLKALAVKHFRGIGPQTQFVGPFSDMNFFVGANNAGKSIILNLIKDRLPFIPGSKGTKLEANSAEAYRGGDTGPFSVAIGRPFQDIYADAVLLLKGTDSNNSVLRGHLATISRKLMHKEFLWQNDGDASGMDSLLWKEDDAGDPTTWLKDEEWNSIWRAITQQSGGGPHHWVPETIKTITAALNIVLPKSMMIPAKRQLGPKDQTFDDLSGKGLIDHLAAIQNPDHHERQKTELFEQINQFVREVTGKTDAKLEVPNNRQHLLVHMDGKVLPIASLGTGIHEVILIAAFCTIYQDHIMCIEEPEIHLHPILQRKLISYLKSKTSNQYFIATHSAAFIDTPGTSAFRVHNDGKQTFVSQAIMPSDTRQLIGELGYRASDILQSNAVIWVEGPSDRIYIQHWLKAEAPELAEGIHYTIMSYGGGLISHLSVDDDAAEEFIRLRKLNQHLAIVIDSDKDGPNAKLKPAAQRLKDELNDDTGIVWITKGREIENYVKADVLHEALQALHPKLYGGQSGVSQYDHSFYFKRKKPPNSEGEIFTKADKVGAALKVCDGGADLNILDLRERITELVSMVRRANGIE